MKLYKQSLAMLAFSVFIIIVSLSLPGCGDGHTIRTSPVLCTVVKENATTTVTCPDGTRVSITDGVNGLPGAPGSDGNSGANGQDGTDGENGEDGHSAVFSQAPAGIAQCPNGGTEISLGTDLNDNSLLDADEVNQTVYVCNGKDGKNGKGGKHGHGKGKGSDS